MKECSKCKKIKHLSEFRIRGGRRTAQCRACDYAYVKEARAAGKTDRRVESVLRYQRHKERVLESNRRSYEANKKRWSMAQARYRYRTKEQKRSYDLLANYGLTVDEFNKMLASQGGVCAICGAAPKNRILSIDHDHKTGLVRGLLCGPCNSAIGMAKENIETIAKMIEYLTKHRELTTA